MPIRINLLAEAQAAEELRRKDPVKRALIASAALVAVVLFWISTLQIRILSAKGDLKNLQSQWTSIKQDYESAVDSKRKSIEVEGKLGALFQLRTNRFLWGTALNAFQQTLSGVDDVQVVRLRTEQSYAQTEAKASSTEPKAAKQLNAVEKISLTIEAVDSSAQPGSQVNRYKESILSVPYFQSHLQPTNAVLLTSLSAPNAGSKPYVMFTLQCFFPEKAR